MKTKQLINDAAAVNSTVMDADHFSPTVNAIAVLAHTFWIQRDRPIGSPEEDWLRAERQINHERTPGSVI